MKEVDCQSLVINAVRTNGGAATKLSNRFIVGVSDLLVKLPDRPAMLLEAKLYKFKGQGPNVFVPDMTVLQYKFLREYVEAGMLGALLSFVEWNNKGVRGLHVACFPLDRDATRGYRLGDHVRSDQHLFIGDQTAENRMSDIVHVIRETPWPKH